MMRSISLQVTNEYNETSLVFALEDETGKMYHEDGTEIQPGEVVTYGYGGEQDEFGTYDYATGKHSSEERRIR